MIKSRTDIKYLNWKNKLTAVKNMIPSKEVQWCSSTWDWWDAAVCLLSNLTLQLFRLPQLCLESYLALLCFNSFCAVHAQKIRCSLFVLVHHTIRGMALNIAEWRKRCSWHQILFVIVIFSVEYFCEIFPSIRPFAMLLTVYLLLYKFCPVC